MSQFEKTTPKPLNQKQDLKPPPRFLLWAVIGLFLIVIGGGIAGILVFREVFNTGQQQRVIGIVPFMESFLPARQTPIGGVVPTVVPPENSGDPLALLDLQISSPTPVTVSEEIAPTATSEPDPTATEVAALPSPTTMPPTATHTAIPAPTQVISTAPPVQAQPQNTETIIGSYQVVNIPSTARMFGFQHIQQTWNNCGPANITMTLAYYGWQEDQAYAAQFLKPNRDDKNVSPNELAQFVNEQTGVRAITRMGGNMELLKALVANEFPVIVETGLKPEAYDWIGHYRTLIAYDDILGIFYFFDSFLGIGVDAQGVTETYQIFDDYWREFNRTYIVVYNQERETELQNLLGKFWDETFVAQHAFEVAQTEARANPLDGFAWFNMGTSLAQLGRYREASNAFDQARNLGIPWRMTWYQFETYEAYYQVGRYEDVLSVAEGNLRTTEYIEETFYWKGRALQALGRTSEAATAYRRALGVNSSFAMARQALNSIN